MVSTTSQNMSRGSTWGTEETECLLYIWADANIKSMLEKTHKNADAFTMFSTRMKEKGFDRSAHQCHVKVKKLRQSYMKVRDALHQSGSSADVKKKCKWYDELDDILGTRPIVAPVDIIENGPPQTSAGQVKAPSLLTSQASPSSSSGDVDIDGNGE